MSKQMKHRGLWIVGSLIVVAGLSVGGYYLFRGTIADAASPAPQPAPAGPKAGDTVSVEVAHPSPGGMARVVVQQATIQAFESVDLYSEVPGFLDKQEIDTGKGVEVVDIGTRVKKGQQIAKIAVPEYEQQLERAKAEWKRSKAAVTQMEARVRTAEADLIAAHAGVVSAQATKASASATKKYRLAMYTRLKALYEKERAIEAKVVDEEQDRYEAAEAAYNSAEAGIHTAEAQVSAADARLASARADVDEAKAKVLVAKAEMDKAQVLVDYSKIVAPFDGVITKRNFFPGDFIASATTGTHLPLLSVDRTDKLRIVVQVPDRDVPYTNVGDTATLLVDALPGHEFTGTVSRIADSEDPQTRNMRTEIDMPNSDGQLRAGMYGQVTLIVEPSNPKAVTIPSAALQGQEQEHISDNKSRGPGSYIMTPKDLKERAQGKKGAVWVVRDGKAHKVEIHIGLDNGKECEVVSGLSTADDVIVSFPGTLTEGVPVAAEPYKKASASH